MVSYADSGARVSVAPRLALVALWLLASTCGAAWGEPLVRGAMRVGQPVTIDLSGPLLDESAPSPGNPFLDYRGVLAVVGPDGAIDVPLYFAADGRAADTGATSGSVWRGLFVPALPGTYSIAASFRKGPGVAVGSPDAGEPAGWFDGETATFTIATLDRYAPGHFARGMLRYVGEHHLRFDDGEYFLKGGANSPENVLAYYEIEGTFDLGGTPTLSLIDGLHQFAVHASDYESRDRENLWGVGKSRGRNLLGALSALARAGVNSVYLLTYNTDGGDGREIWPWVEPEGDKLHFDVSKLGQWDRVFTHMDRSGLQIHLVTEETENDVVLGTSLTVARRLYYRELVARFAHHNALVWNIGEESTHSPSDEIDFAGYLRALDPYDHPITVHTRYDEALTKYPPLYGAPVFEATSIQGEATNYHEWAETIRADTVATGRPWVVCGDEQGPPVDSSVGGVIGNLDELRRDALWGNLMAGGAGVEWYFGYQDTFGDLETEDFGLADTLWADTRHALGFFQGFLPFHEMTTSDALATAPGAHVLAKAGDTYAVYLPGGGTTSLSIAAGTYRVHWFDPRNGGPPIASSVSEVLGPGVVALGDPPNAPSGDWAVLVWPCAAPAGSPRLRMDGADPSRTTLSWMPPFGTMSSDVAYGDLSVLRAAGGDFATATEGCLAPSTPETTVDDATIPAAGRTIWYLVRPRSCEAGSHDSEAGGTPGARDIGIAASGRGCE